MTSRIDRRWVAYPIVGVSLALLSYLGLHGVSGSIQEKIATGLIELLYIFGSAAVLSKTAQLAVEHWVTRRFGSGSPEPAQEQEPQPEHKQKPKK